MWCRPHATAVTRSGLITWVTKYLKFFENGWDASNTVLGSFDPVLVILSILIASLAAYAALCFAAQVNASDQVATKRKWLVAGAVAMGIGIWAMHFIGMLALILPLNVTYDLQTTYFSALPVMIVSGLALSMISRTSLSSWQLIVGGVLVGLGINTMHFSGLSAMRTSAEMFYDPTWFTLSIIIAVALTTLSIRIHRLVSSGSEKWRGHRAKVGAAVVMGCSLSGVHYTGMASVHFVSTGGSLTTRPRWRGGTGSLRSTALIASRPRSERSDAGAQPSDAVSTTRRLRLRLRANRHATDTA